MSEQSAQSDSLEKLTHGWRVLMAAYDGFSELFVEEGVTLPRPPEESLEDFHAAHPEFHYRMRREMDFVLSMRAELNKIVNELPPDLEVKINLMFALDVLVTRIKLRVERELAAQQQGGLAR